MYVIVIGIDVICVKIEAFVCDKKSALTLFIKVRNFMFSE